MKEDNVYLWPSIRNDPLICYYLERIDELVNSALTEEDECHHLLVWLADSYEACQPEEFQKMAIWYETDPVSFLHSEFADYQVLFAYPSEGDDTQEKKEKITQDTDQALHDYYEYRIRLLEHKTEQLRTKYLSICNLCLNFYKKYKPEEYQRIWDEVTQMPLLPSSSPAIQSACTQFSGIEVKNSKTKLFLRTLPLSAKERIDSPSPNGYE